MVIGYYHPPNYDTTFLVLMVIGYYHQPNYDTTVKYERINIKSK